MANRFVSNVGIATPEVPYWSSTRTGNDAYTFMTDWYIWYDDPRGWAIDPTAHYSISNVVGFVRCFKDAPIIPQTYIVSFFSGTQLVASWEIVDGGLRNEDIPSVTKEWYNFDYRYIQWAEDTGFDFSKTAITWNISLYAKLTCKPWYKENTEWTACNIETYTITYVLDWWINNENNTWTYTVETESINLLDPIKEWYNFNGWYSEIEFTNQVREIRQWSTWDKTLYAKRWWCSQWYFENDEGICEKFNVEFDANWWKYESGESKYKVEVLANKVSEKENKILHTINLQDNGEYIINTAWVQWIYVYNGKPLFYRWNQNVTNVLKFTEEWNLQLNIKYWWALASNCVWIAMWTWEHSDYTIASNSGSAFMLQHWSNFSMSSNFDLEYGVNSDAVTVSIFTNCPSFGYYLTVTKLAKYEVYYADGTFDNIPEPTREWHSFKWWYLSGGIEFNTWSDM